MFIIIASLPSQIVEFRRLARLLQERGEVVRLYVERESMLSEPGAEILPSPAAPGFNVRMLIAEKLSKSLFARTVFGSISAALHEYRRQMPEAVIVGEDGVGGNLAWIAAAKKLDIPVIVLPYEYSGAEQAIAAIRPNIDDFRVSGTIARLFSRLRPQWIRLVDGEPVLRLPLRLALAYEMAGVGPSNPWTVHGGQAGVLLAESPQMIAHYKREGVPEDKVFHAGSLAFDDLHRALLHAPRRGDSLRILCALPPDYTSDRGPLPYDELVRLWLNEARKHGDVTVQAHPSARESLTKIGVDFDSRDITTLIAENDLMVTSVSSIIRYALAAGRPVLNFDCYRFDYPDYAAAAGCKTVSSVTDYIGAIADIAAHFEAYARSTVDEAATWGTLDGKSADRIASILSLGGQASA
jgi:hypothetical protein